MRRFLILCTFFGLSFNSWAQYCGLENSVPISNFQRDSILIDITSFINDDLSDPNQGVCEVKLNFSHLNIMTMEIFLESPSGQTIQLIGPQLPNFFPNFNTKTFDISFVSCSATANPDMFLGDTWDNNSNFDLSNNYTGSYFPVAGCLEDLNTGTVNGQWKLIFETEDGGFGPGPLPTSGFNEVEIIFCDDEGNPCCDANAGTFTDAPVEVCAGDPALVFTPVPQYSITPPDTMLFGFTYLISNSDGIILEATDAPDLSAYPAGVYQVCGLSFDLDDLTQIPIPTDSVNINDLRSNLASNAALFCGDLSTTCVDVTILAPSPITTIDTTICDGQIVTICGTDFSIAGVYNVPCTNVNGCDSIVNLILDVTDVIFTTRSATICAGDSIQISAGGPFYSTTDNFQESFASTGGCDSVILFSLTVLDSVVSTKDITICEGDNFIENTDTFRIAGNYEVVYENAAANGCDSIVRIQLEVLNSNPIVQPADIITCASPISILDGTASEPIGEVAYVWLDSIRQPLGNDANLPVTEGGTYFLTANIIRNGVLCSNEVEVFVEEDLTPPIADAGPDRAIDCNQPQAIIGTFNTTDSSNITYQWTSLDGNVLVGEDEIRALADAAGTYTLVVQNTDNGCVDSSTVNVTADLTAPVIDIQPWINLSCSIDSTIVDASNSTLQNGIIFSWASITGGTIGNTNTLMPVIFDPGNYRLLMTDTLNGCVDSAFVQVEIDTLKPTITIAPVTEVVSCNNPLVMLDATGSDEGVEFEISWSSPNGGRIASGETSLTPMVDTGGIYRLTIRNIITGCLDSMEVVVSENFVDVMPVLVKSSDLNCIENTVTIDAKGSFPLVGGTYQWSTTDGNILGPDNEDVLVVDSAGTYMVIVEDIGSGCNDSLSIDVVFDTIPPTVEAGNTFSLTCTNPNANLNSTGSSVGADFDYSWTGPCIVDGANSGAPLIDCAGTYFLTIRNTFNGCVGMDSVVILDNTIPPVAEAGADTTVNCDAPTIILGSDNTTTAIGVNYLWTGPGFISGETTRFPEVDQEGTYFLIVTNTVTGCFSADSVMVTVDTLMPIAEAGLDQIINCIDTIANLGGLNTSVGPDLTYSWTTEDGRFTGPIDSIFTTTDSAGTFKLVVENMRNACIDSATVSITFDQETPFVDLGTNQELNCAVNSVTIGTSNTSQGTDIIYNWSGPACFVSPTDVNQVVVNCEGMYMLEVVDTINGCFVVDSVLVTLDTIAPSAMVLQDTVLIDCSNGEAILDASNATNGSFSWRFNGVEVGQDTMIVVRDTGTYTLIVEDMLRGCLDSTTVEVILDCEVEANIATPELLTCDRQVVTLDASSSITGTNQESYQWRAEDPICILTPTNAPSIEIACSGFYTVVVTNLAVGIIDSQTIFVGIDTIAPRAIAGEPDTLTCDNPTAIIDASRSSIGLETVFSWYTFDGDTISNEVSTTVDSAGIYIFEIRNQNNGCSSTDFVEIGRNFTVPTVSFGNNIFPCEPDTLLLEATLSPESNNYEYSWTGPQILGNIDSLNVVVGGPGLYRITILNLENGCVVTDSIQVEAQSCPPCITLAQPDTITCLRNSVSLVAILCEPCDGCTFEWTTLDGNITAGADSQFPMVNDPGIYTLVATDTTGLFTRVSVTVIGDTLPPLINAGADRNLTCTDTSLDLNGSFIDNQALTFQWYPSDEAGNLLSTTNQLTVNQPGNYVFAASNTRTGCIGTDTIMIALDTVPPVADAGLNQQITCLNEFARLEGENSSGGIGFTYNWSTADGNLLTGENTANPIADQAGIYQLLVTDTTNGCFAIDEIEVTIQTELPEILPISDQEITCVVERVDLVGNLPAPLGFDARWYEINRNGDTVNIRNTLEINTSRAGDYFFEVVNEETGCMTTSVVNVSENTVSPQIDAGEDLELTCSVVLQQLQGVLLSGEAFIEVNWSAASGNILDNPSTLEPLIDAPDTYILNVRNLVNGCTATDSIVVILDDNAPEISFDNPDNELITCLRPEVNLTTAITTTGGDFVAQWRAIDGGSFRGRTDQPAVTVNGGGVYELLVTDLENGCDSRDSIIVDENFFTPNLVLDTLEGTLLNCNISSLAFDLSNSTNPSDTMIIFSYRDSLGGILGEFFNTPNLSVEEPGSYFLIGENAANGCSDSLFLTIAGDFEQPVIQIENPLPITCIRSEVLIEAPNTSIGTELQYEWTGDGPFQTQADPLSILAQSIGSYQLKVTDASNGCSDSLAVSVGIDTISPTVLIAEPMILDCENSVIELDGSATAVGTNFTYNWQTEVGGAVIAGIDSTVALVDSAGIYSLRVTDNNNGCIGIGLITVDEDAEPIDELFFTINPPDCLGDGTASITIDSVVGGLGPFAFGVDSDVFLMQNIFTNLTPDTHSIKVLDVRGCTLERQFVITETPDLNLELGPDLSIKLGDSVRVEALVNRSFDSLVWRPSNDLENPGNAVQILKPLQTTAYQVFVRDSLNCTAEETIIITVTTPESHFVPNAFSPNGDGTNDILYLFADDDVQNVKSFYIFDRWGTIVFERTNFQPNDPNFGWDGNHKGRRMRSAVFVYSAELEFIDGRTEIVKGDFVLLDK